MGNVGDCPGRNLFGGAPPKKSPIFYSKTTNFQVSGLVAEAPLPPGQLAAVCVSETNNESVFHKLQITSQSLFLPDAAPELSSAPDAAGCGCGFVRPGRKSRQDRF
ncbi:Hypothetical protein FKW44_003091 [Caligus rogercresseyi]|uniref:Uncharacterized protein n=1 Tax=Caligus rogercresseyi TaxID=217165 RepID=A0A7T8KL32_CALRO|nr:Hypothetical protein FKW44_003091 [Caligus rogercresseyi]